MVKCSVAIACVIFLISWLKFTNFLVEAFIIFYRVIIEVRLFRLRVRAFQKAPFSFWKFGHLHVKERGFSQTIFWLKL